MTTSADTAAIEPVAKPNYVAIARESGLHLRIDSKFGNPNYESVSGSWPALLKFAELLSTAPTTGSAPVAVKAFGIGAQVVIEGAFDGEHAVLILPAKQPGEVGASAKREGPITDDSLVDAVVLTFPTAEQVERVANALVAAPPANAPGASVPANVAAALDRMCSPLCDSRLSGVTAQEDARCMQIIRDYVLSTPAITVAKSLNEDELTELYHRAQVQSRQHWIENARIALLAASMGGDRT